MKSIVVALLLAVAAPAAADPEAVPPRGFRLQLGTQVGFPQIIGVHALGTFSWWNRPRFDVDFLWEPSNYLQSYSVGAAYHPADRMFFVGLRLRLLQFGAPWSPGFSSVVSDQLGIGMEAGLRKGFGWQRRLLLSVTVQATAVPTEAPQQQWLFGLNVGLSYAVLVR